MVIGIVALVAGIAALVAAAIALVKISDLTSEFETHQRSINETADGLRREVTAMSKRLPPPPADPRSITGLPPNVKPTIPHEEPHIMKMQLRKPKPSGPPPPPPRSPGRHESPRPPVAPPVAAPPPAPPPPPEPPAEEGLFVNFDCPQCGQNIDAPAAMIGLTVPCPNCRNPMSVPDRQGGPPRSPPPEPAKSATEDAGLDELAEEAMKGATVRIDLQQVFEEADHPKRQIIIKRRQ